MNATAETPPSQSSLSVLTTLQYVGRTTRALNIRIGEHIGNIKRGFIGHSVSKHFRLCHNQNSSLLQVIAIEKYVPHWGGDNLKRNISRRGTKWIYDLQCYRPWGLNIEWDTNCFIDNS